jgi:hypothetical protein
MRGLPDSSYIGRSQVAQSLVIGWVRHRPAVIREKILQ